MTKIVIIKIVWIRIKNTHTQKKKEETLRNKIRHLETFYVDVPDIL